MPYRRAGHGIRNHKLDVLLAGRPVIPVDRALRHDAAEKFQYVLDRSRPCAAATLKLASAVRTDLQANHVTKSQRR